MLEYGSSPGPAADGHGLDPCLMFYKGHDKAPNLPKSLNITCLTINHFSIAKA